MVIRVRDPAFRVTSSLGRIEFGDVSAGQEGSRLWESNPRPTHYEGPPHHPGPSLAATLLQFDSHDGAASASLDASSRHNPCHDSSSSERRTSCCHDPS